MSEINYRYPLPPYHLDEFPIAPISKEPDINGTMWYYPGMNRYPETVLFVQYYPGTEPSPLPHWVGAVMGATPGPEARAVHNPEPAAWILLVTGLIFLILFKRAKQ